MATILVVDDRAVNRNFLATLFGYAGHRVLEAADGADALARARADSVDLVVTDILMPTMDGVELARRLRADAAIAHIPIIFYTATYRQADARRLAVECGAQEVLSKPSEPSVILDAVTRYVGPGPTILALHAAEAPLPRPPGQVVEHLAGYLDDLAELQTQLSRIIDHGQQLLGKSGDLRQLSYSLSDSFTKLQTISLRLSALVEMGLEVSCAHEPASLVETFCRGAQDIVGAQHAAVGMLDGAGGLEHLYTRNVSGQSRAALDALLPASGILGEAVAAGMARKVLAQQSSLPQLVVPVKSPQRSYGWVWFEGKLAGSEFSEEDEHFAVTLAAQFALAYENLALHEERRRAQESLAESEERFRQMAEHMRDVFYLTDLKTTRMLYVNPAYEDIWGRSRESLYAEPRSWADSIHPDDRSRVFELFQRGMETGRYDYEYRIVRPDGEVRWIHVRGFPIRDVAGNVYRVAGIASDITERLRLQAALMEREAGLRRAQLMAKLAHVITGPDGEFETWSETLPQLVGMEPAEVPTSTRGWLGLLHPDDRELFRGKSINAGVSGTREDVEYRLRRGDGSWIHVRQAIEPMPSHLLADGKTRWFSTLQDVTEQKQAEIRIRGLNRVYAMLSGINTLLVRAQDRGELFREACRIAVEQGRFRMAWIGLIGGGSKRVEPIAWDGDVRGFFESAPPGVLDARAKGKGLAWRAIREQKPVISNDIQNDPQTSMKQQCKERGINSLVMLPLVVGGDAVGVLALYAAETGFFDDAEMTLLVELAGDISFCLDHLAKAEKLNYLAYYDELTGLANRSLFLERLRQKIIDVGSAQSEIAVWIVDIERFRSINDAFGRQLGDRLLQQVAERMKGAGGDATRLARLGADHFAVASEAVENVDDIARLTERRVRQVFDPPYLVADQELRLSVRFGIAIFPNDGNDAETLLRNAEAALKKAKTVGERYLFFDQTMTERIAEKLALENRLRQALERDEFVLHYQPKVDLETRTVKGVEALIRWQDPERGLLPPGQFIPLLEETGLILEVGTWALKRAALDHRRWTEQKLKAPRVAVNVSQIQLRQRDFVAVVEQAIIDGIAPTGIDLEITESLVMQDVKANIEKLNAVRGLGVRIAIDDFGTGYSSLGYLARLPVEALKIDRSFVIAMHTDPNAMALVSTIISLAHSLRLKVIAEGVESEEQAKFLRLLRCDEMQGYLIGKPVPEAELVKLLRG